jgi:hypothetical protein
VHSGHIVNSLPGTNGLGTGSTLSFSLPDYDNRHAIAAAMVAGADVIVTDNLKDFPDKDLNIYGIETQHPD